METYCHLLVPYIDRAIDLKTIIWDEISIRGGSDSIVSKAVRKMQQNEQLITQWAPALLNMQMENLLWQNRNEINVGDLWKLLCTYCYLPRLASFEVLQNAIQAGVNSEEYFAYADSVSDGKYTALKYNQYVGFVDRSGYLVKQLAALKQKASETHAAQPVLSQSSVIADNFANSDDGQSTPASTTQTATAAPVQPPKPQNCHFEMLTTLDATRVVKNVGSLMDEVINHLLQVDGATVEIKLLVDATMPDGTPVTTVRTVNENCKTLKVEKFGFND